MTRGFPLVLELLVIFGLSYLGKWLYAWLQRWPRIDHELTARDNIAFAVPLGTYYLGLFFLVAGSEAPSDGYSIFRVALTGAAGVGLLNLGMRIMDVSFFKTVSLHDRILHGRSLPAGVLLAGSNLAAALVVWGALANSGGWLPTLVFWSYGQAILVVSGRLFLVLGRYRLLHELRRGNLAVALPVAGGLVALGNVVRVALNGPFTGWSNSFALCTGYALGGVGILLLIRKGLDWLLLPGVTIRHEIVRQEVPNVGIGFILAVFYIGLSLVAGWAL